MRDAHITFLGLIVVGVLFFLLSGSLMNEYVRVKCEQYKREKDRVPYVVVVFDIRSEGVLPMFADGAHVEDIAITREA